MGKKKINLQIAATYIGAVVGAGFASGQEMMQFFIPFGQKAYWGIVLITILFVILGTIILRISQRVHLNSYQEIVSYLLGPQFGQFVDGLITIFLFFSFCIMLAGSGAIFAEHLGSTTSLGTGLAAACLLIVLAGEVKGIVWFNSVLVPLKLILCLGVSIAVWVMGDGSLPMISVDLPGMTPISKNWVWASLLYVSYNMILGMVILCSLGSYVSQARSYLGAVWGGLGLGTLAFAIVYALQTNYPAVVQYEVPMLYIAASIHPVVKLLYAIVLWLGILTTAVVNGYGFAQRIAVFSGIPYFFCLVLTVVLAIPFAQFSFSALVRTIYPLFGYIGVVLLAGLIIHARK